MRLGYCSVSLPSLSPQEAVAALSDNGFEGIEWKVGDAPHAMHSTANSFLQGNRCTITPSVKAAEEARELCDQANVELIGLSPYIDVGDTDYLKRVLDMAKASGAPQIRWQGPRLNGRRNYSELFRDSETFLGEAERLAAEAGVRFLVELHHNTIVPSASLAHRLVSKHDPAVVGVIYDIGNLVFEGYENHQIGLELLGDYVQHVHLKNVAAERAAPSSGASIWRYTWSRLDDGFVDVADVFARLREFSYDGWISMEDLSAPDDPHGSIKHNASVLSRALMDAA